VQHSRRHLASGRRESAATRAHARHRPDDADAEPQAPGAEWCNRPCSASRRPHQGDDADIQREKSPRGGAPALGPRSRQGTPRAGHDRVGGRAAAAGPLASGRRQEAQTDSGPEPCPAKARTKRKPLMSIERRMRGRVVVALGTGTMASVLGAMVANRWFTERRGVVLGLLTASSATGQLLFLPLLASMVVRLGWRSAVLLVAGVALVVLPLVALLMRDHPRDIGLRPFGEPPNAPPTPRPPRAAAAPPLIGTHLIPASMEHGIPEVMAASLLASIGLLDIIGTTVSGWLSDRWDNRYLLCWYYGLRGLSLLFLPYAFGSAYLGLAAFVIFYGLDWVATVPPTARLAADTFGRENVGIMFGWIAASHQLGAATAAYGGGLLHTWLGDYQVTFMSAGLVCLIAAGLVLRIGQASGPRARRDGASAWMWTQPSRGPTW